jgi:predicted nucleotidyltransferase
VHAVDPLAIVLFGSRARGDHRPASDVDLLVVVPEGLSTGQVCGMLDRRRALADAPLGVDLVVATPARLAAARGLQQRAALGAGAGCRDISRRRRAGA